MAIELRGTAFAAVGLIALMVTGTQDVGKAEPLISQGIGTANCDRLADDIDPAQGLSSPINLLLVAWVQGYISAANIALLEDDSRHVDMNLLDDTKVLALVQAFCKANPDKKAVAAIDDLIRKSSKVKTTWEPGTIDWNGSDGDADEDRHPAEAHP